MAYRNLTPLVNPEGDVRELTSEDFAWLVSAADFADQHAVLQFIKGRNAFFRRAEKLGFDNAEFFPVQPRVEPPGCDPGAHLSSPRAMDYARVREQAAPRAAGDDQGRHRHPRTVIPKTGLFRPPRFRSIAARRTE